MQSETVPPDPGQSDPRQPGTETAGLPGPAPRIPAGPATGDLRVDHALADLRELASRPVAEHPAIFDRVHQRLRDVLGELDGQPPGGLQGRGG